MHRHEVEPGDALTHTTMRHGDGARADPGPADAKAVFFGASYHADYATILAAPGRPAGGRRRARRTTSPTAATRHPRPGTSSTCAGCAAATRPPTRWRPPSGARDRRGLDAQRRARGRLPGRRRCRPAATIDDFLATLGKKERHEIRRKVRRAEAAGEIRLDDSADPLADLDAFIDLHQKPLGRRRPVPDDAGRRPEPAVRSGACSSSRRGRPAAAARS